MYDVGRLCVKIAGRDAGLKCVVVDVIDDNFVMIDGQTRRRKCNVRHLEPLKDVIKLKKGADHKDVATEFKKLKIEIKESKPKKASPRPIKQRQKKETPAKEKESLEEKAKKKSKKKDDKSEKKSSTRKKASESKAKTKK